MAVFYLDTSALVKRYRTEQGTEVVEELLANPSPDERFFICFLSIIELTSGVLRLARGGQLREDTANGILARFRLDVRELFRVWPLNEQVAADSVTALAAKINEGESKIALMPAFYTLLFFLEAFAVAERRISRERELAADEAGARLAGVNSMASALLKVHAFSGLWEDILHAMREALAQGKQFVNVSSLFAEVVKQNNTPAALDGLQERRLSHPTDTHPTLNDRLQALGLSVRDVADAALLTSPEFPTIDLISNYEDLEKNLTEAEHALMVKLGEAEIGSSLRGSTEPNYGQNAPAKECPACAMFNPIDTVECLYGYQFRKETGVS